ncbi:MAG: HAD family phosphatase [Candidatus Omnitrophica bacterium]|jgi:putative hydrolase of the HAD superfamily|nr:HAD family phosphatase [Candidatus Omnitrophota bacterium]MDD3274392.1 HAD family phosphatase [Candidatus Omnitrophota bacterium]MDD5077441.1 HAD family phosphatase [Candidatus Omnitrophota bacterium]MDD5724877.1 HAD family phosphatase [Candidatus Omnitrophota bacterium]
MSQEIKVILFDLGRVLVDFDHLRAAERIAGFCGKTPRQVYDLFFESPATLAFEAGKISPQDFYLEVKRMLGMELSYSSFEPIWNDIFFLSAKNRAVFGAANSLRSRYKLAMLSNINILHYEYLNKNFPVFGIFDEVFLSFKMGTIKPDKKIYETVVQQLAVAPHEIFYVDDRPELVQSAKTLGFKGSVFTDFKSFLRDLAECGITVSLPENNGLL